MYSYDEFSSWNQHQGRSLTGPAGGGLQLGPTFCSRETAFVFYPQAMLPATHLITYAHPGLIINNGLVGEACHGAMYAVHVARRSEEPSWSWFRPSLQPDLASILFCTLRHLGVMALARLKNISSLASPWSGLIREKLPEVPRLHQPARGTVSSLQMHANEPSHSGTTGVQIPVTHPAHDHWRGTAQHGRIRAQWLLSPFPD